MSRGVALVVLWTIVHSHAWEDANTRTEFLEKSTDPEKDISLFYRPSYGGGFGEGVSVTHKSYFDVLKEKLIHALLGIGLVILAFPVLYFNEKRQVHMEKIFAYGESIVKDNVSSDRVDPANDLCLVNVQGQTSTEDELVDKESGVSVTNCAKLKSVAEMYQWVEDQQSEEQDAPGGGKDTVTTYSYRMDWRSGRVESEQFNQPQGHENPPFSLTGSDLVASSVSFGGYALMRDLVDQMVKETPVTKESELEMAGRTFKLQGDVYTTVQKDQGSPELGDMQYTIKKVECGDATVLSIQKDNTFTPLTFALVPDRKFCGSGPATGDKVSALEQPLLGNRKKDEIHGCCSLIGAAMSYKEELHDLAEEKLSAVEMFDRAKSAQDMIRKVVKFVGFLMFFIGFYCQFSFFPALFRFIPFIGTWIEAFGNFFAVLGAIFMALFHYCLTVAIAWIVLRPIKGVMLLCFAFAIIAVPTYLAHLSQQGAVN